MQIAWILFDKQKKYSIQQKHNKIMKKGAKMHKKKDIQWKIEKNARTNMD